MNRTAVLGLSFGASFLRCVYPDVNWEAFLAMNLHGLTEGYPTIPFDTSFNHINYDLDDLEAFAFTYGEGKVSGETIARHAEEYLKRLDEEVNAGFHGPRGDLLADDATDDKGYFHLSKGEYLAMFEHLCNIQRACSQSSDALAMLATTIRTFSTAGVPTTKEADALYRLAGLHADRAFEAHSIAAELTETLSERDQRKFFEQMKTNAEGRATEIADHLRGLLN